MTYAERCRRLGTPDRRRRIRLGACIGVWCAYALGLAPLYRMAGPGATALVALPVLLTASLFGILPGIASGVLSYAVTLPLLFAAGYPGTLGQAVVQCACPAAALLVIAAAVGRLRTLRDRLASQVEDRKSVV